MELKKIIRQGLWQIGLILIFSALLAFTTNGIRKEGLSLPKTEQDKIKNTIELKEARYLFEKNQAVFIDARDIREYEKGHIKGAFSLPFLNFERFFPDFFEKIKEEELLVIYCDGKFCDLSQKVSELLYQYDYKKSLILDNGWTEWKKAKLPIE